MSVGRGHKTGKKGERRFKEGAEGNRKENTGYYKWEEAERWGEWAVARPCMKIGKGRLE